MPLRLVIRGLLRAPAFTIASIGTIALAVCLSTAVFAVVDGVLFKPLPYPEAGELSIVVGLPQDRDEGVLSAPDRRRLQSVTPRVPMTMFGGWSVSPHPADPKRGVRGAHVDRRFFEVLGTRPLAGGFDDADFRQPYAEDRVRPVIVAYEFWRDYLGGTALPPGSVFNLRRARFRIAGILPPGFVFPDARSSRVELLFAMPDRSAERSGPWDRNYVTLARIPGADAASVREQWSAAIASAAREYGPAPRADVRAYERVDFTPLSQVLGVRERPFFLVAFAGAAWLVLIACVNVASLSLARTRARARELRLCVALGAGRRRIAGLVIPEILIVTLAGAALGLGLAVSMLGVVQHNLPERLNLLRPLATDWRVTLFALAAPLASMLGLSIIPMRRAFRDAPSSTAALTSTMRARSWGASALLAVESGLGVAVLVIGSFVLTSFALLRNEPSGFDDERLLVAEVTLREAALTEDQRAALQDDLLARLSTVPGIDGAALVGGALFDNTYSALSLEPPAGRPDLHVLQVPVSEQFFEIAGIGLEEGRLPTSEEIRRGEPVAVVSLPAARALWGDGPALGRIVRARWDATSYTVIGVVSDVRMYAQYRSHDGEVFTPLSRFQTARMYGTYVLRASGDPRIASGAVHQMLERDVPAVFVDRVAPFADAIAGTVPLQRFQAALFGTAAGAAVLMLAVGVAGIVAASVRRRWREAGIRSALGAARRRIVWMLVVDHLRPCAVGIAFGLLIGWWGRSALVSLLYELEPGDFRVWTAASAFVLLVVILAAWVPARRAASVDPSLVLRAE